MVVEEMEDVLSLGGGMQRYINSRLYLLTCCRREHIPCMTN